MSGVSLVDRNSHARTRVHTRSCVRCACTCNTPRSGGTLGIIVTLKWVVGDPEPERRTKVMLRGFRALSLFHVFIAYRVAIAQSRPREYADGIFIDASACGDRIEERKRERERERHPRAREVPWRNGLAPERYLFSHFDQPPTFRGCPLISAKRS